MDLETLKAEHPELVEAITAEALAGQPAAIEAARQEGAAGERSRIAAVREQLIPGHEALIEKLAFDGVSTGADAAMALVSAEKGLREQAQAAIAADAQPLIPAADAGGPSASTMKRAEFNQLAPADQRAFAKAGGKIAD